MRLTTANGCPSLLFPESLNYGLCRLRAGEILLTSDLVAVPNREAPPKSTLDVIGANLLHFVLDAPGHDVLVAREKIHVPNCIISEVFLNIREARDCPTPRQVRTV